jgi:O-antigen/teichoic acid export membrane protein
MEPGRDQITPGSPRGAPGSNPERGELRATLARSQTVKAAGLAIASMAANVVQAVFVATFAHVLGAASYGSLARLVTAVIILAVPGVALQAATAREVALGRLGNGTEQSATLASWARHLGIVLIVVSVAGIALRHQLAALVSVDEAWAAAGVLPTGVLWLMLSLERGILSGLHAYRPVGLSIVGEAVGRLGFALLLALLGLGVTGAFLGLPLTYILVSGILARALRRRLGAPSGRVRRSLSSLVAGARTPVAGLTLVFLLQNIDIFLIPHLASKKAAGAYAGAATAAKIAIWVAIGIAVYLLPEAARRAAEGRDPRPVLARAVAIVAAVALPALLVFTFVPDLLLRVALGPDFERAAGALALLGAAMSLLALVNLAVQYLLALFQYRFVFLLAAVAALEPLFLLEAPSGLAPFAAMVLLTQTVAAAGMLLLALRTRRLALGPAQRGRPTAHPRARPTDGVA